MSMRLILSPVMPEPGRRQPRQAIGRCEADSSLSDVSQRTRPAPSRSPTWQTSRPARGTRPHQQPRALCAEAAEGRALLIGGAGNTTAIFRRHPTAGRQPARSLPVRVRKPVSRRPWAPYRRAWFLPSFQAVGAQHQLWVRGWSAVSAVSARLLYPGQRGAWPEARRSSAGGSYEAVLTFHLPLSLEASAQISAGMWEWRKSEIHASAAAGIAGYPSAVMARRPSAKRASKSASAC